MSTCSAILRRQGKPYPRTCPVHGIGVCAPLPKTVPSQDLQDVSDTEALVTKDILSRQALGIAKYGTTVAGNPLNLREWLQHAYEECLDQAVYLKRAIQEIGKGEASMERSPAEIEIKRQRTAKTWTGMHSKKGQSNEDTP